MSQRQPKVATTEIEIVAATESIGYKEMPKLKVDKNRRTNHIALEHFFGREKLSEKELDVQSLKLKYLSYRSAMTFKC